MQLLPLLAGDEQLAGLTSLEGAHIAALLHLVHQACGAGVAQLQTALEHGDGGLSGLQNDVDRRREHFVAFRAVCLCSCAARAAGAGFPALGRLFVDLGHDGIGVFRFAGCLDEGDDLLHLVVRDKAALHALGFALSERRIEHIALADELFRARRIENDARLHRGGDSERDA